MLYREIIAVCSQIHTKHINTLCGQNVELYINIQFVPRSKHSVSVVTAQTMYCNVILMRVLATFFWSGKAIRITYSQCVSTASIIYMQSACAVFYCSMPPVSLYHIFPTLSHKRHDFWKRFFDHVSCSRFEGFHQKAEERIHFFFRVMTSCSLVDGYWYCRRAHCLCLQGRSSWYWPARLHGV